MHYTKTTPKIVSDLYTIFERICKPRIPLEKDEPAEDISRLILTELQHSTFALRVTSEYGGIGPKLHFDQSQGTLEVKFLPNLDYTNPSELTQIPKAEEVAKEFQRAAKSYLRHVDKIFGNA